MIDPVSASLQGPSKRHPEPFRWLRAQIQSVRAGGLRALLRKLWLLVACIPAVPVVIMVRCARPLVLIRFGRLISARIGHFAMNTEVWLCKRDVSPPSKRVYDLFCLSGAVCNRQLLTMWSRVLFISSFVEPLFRVNALLPGAAPHTLHLDTDWDPEGLLVQVPQHIHFTPEEEERGARELEEMLGDRSAQFICFDARDPRYLTEMYPDTDWRYHDYRDADIRHCLPAARKLVALGYFAIRMGAKVSSPLPETEPGIIDYATTRRSDFMDIYLCAKCRFFMGSSGLRITPNIFRRPAVFLNLVPLTHFWGVSPLNLVLPKKYWSRSEQRLLTFREILASDVGKYVRTEQFQQAGIKLLENTPDEITAAAMEMEQRLNGSWESTEEDEELHQRFLELFQVLGWKKTVSARIAAGFLRKHAELLE